ncbi:MAG: HYR domain-containing protein [Thaumarchaeota archaeon]|nr:HYR domain-containing protein [Nitrososphaerota archaeon]
MSGSTLALIAASALALAAPAAALAQFSMEDDDAGIPAPPPAAPPGQPAVDEEIEEPGAPPWGIVPEDPTEGHVAVVNELMGAHRDLTGIMEAQSAGDYSTPDYPFVMTYVDEENEELVVMMHTMAALAGIEYEEREIQVALDTEADIKITYGTIELDATPVQIESWKQYYRANCLPSYRPGYQTACILYEGYLRENGVDPSSLGTPSAPSPTLSTADPCAQSRSSLACYYMTQYKNRCLPTSTTSRCSTYATQITTAGYALPTPPNPAPAPAPNPAPAPAPNPAPAPAPLNPAPVPVSGATVFSDDFESGLTTKWVETGEFDWRADGPDEGTNPPSHPSSNRVAEADNCDIGCVLTMRSFLNLSGHSSATLEFWRYIDTSLDAGEYLRVQVHSNGRWTTVYSWGGGIGDDDRWHKESYSLAGKLTNDFRVRFVAKMSSSSEEVAIDDVAVRGTRRASADTVPPVVTVPADMTRTAPSSSGVAVTYTATARDAVDGSITPACSPASGSTFRVGTTTVRCTATDAARNTGSATFRVTVRTADTAAPALSLPADMTVAAPSAYGAHVTYTATARDAVDGPVATSCWPRSGDRFFVGETTVTCRAWDSSRNQARASFQVTVTPFSPAPAPGAAVLSEGFEGGLSRWVESGEPDWRTGRHEEHYDPDGTRTGTTANMVATADDCDTGCTLTLARALDLSGRTGATLTFSRFVDRSLDSGEYLRVQAHKGGSWATIYSWGGGSGGDDDRWHHESYSLSSYLVSDFKVRFVARMSSSGEEAAVDNVEVRATGGRGADTAAPVVTVPADISRTSASGVAVTYAATARDAVDGSITPTCSPASGSTFAVGATTVRCTATDAAGNTGRASFTVTVTAPDTAAPVITAPSAMSFSATSASGATVAYTVTARDAVDGTIAPTCSPPSESTFAVGSTTVRCTATDAAGNTGRASFTVTVTPLPAPTPPTPPPANQCPAPGPSGAAGSSSAAPCPGTTATAPVTVFEDDFQSGMSKWTVTGGGWANIDSTDGNPAGSPSSNKVAGTNHCTSECSIKMSSAVDLSSYASATLTFWRYVDTTLDARDYFKVTSYGVTPAADIYEWTHRSDTRGKWVQESYSLADHLVANFNVSFVARVDRESVEEGAAAVDKDVAIDAVVITGTASKPTANSPPVIRGPASISYVANPASTTHEVTFVVTAMDDIDGSITPSCKWRSQGADQSSSEKGLFDVGASPITTTVTCTVTDSGGLTTSHKFTVVTSRPEPASPSATTTLNLRGGLPVHIHQHNAVTQKFHTFSATIGLVVTHTDNKPAVLVSSHAVTAEHPNLTFSGAYVDKLPKHRHAGTSSAFIDHPLIGTTVLANTRSVPGSTTSADAALVHISDPGVTANFGQIQRGTSAITVSEYGGAKGLINSMAEIVGRHTQSTGKILHKNVTIKAPDSFEGPHRIFTDHMIALYSSIKGDSGAPILHVNSDSTRLLGIHVGRADEIVLDSTGEVLHGDPTARNDKGVGIPQFSIFSTWENVRRDLALP